MNKKIAIAILVFLLTCSLGWTEDWLRFRKDEHNSARAEELLQPPLSVKWTFKAPEAIISSPSVGEGLVYIGCRDKNLYALNASTGGLVWKYTTGDWVDSSAAISDGNLYFTSRDGNLYCLKASDGQFLWKYQSGGTDCSSALVADGLVFAGSGFPNKFIYALDSDAGLKTWQTETGQMVYSSPAASGQNLYIGSNDGNLYCLKRSNGAVQWKFSTKGRFHFTCPSIDDQRVYLASGYFDWNIYALNINSGKLLWKHTIEDRKPTPTYVSSIAQGSGKIFVVSGYETQYLYCLNSSSGALIWKKELSPSTRLGFASSPCVTEDVVYVVSAEGKLLSFEIATGRLLWQYDLGAKVLSSPCVSEGILYIATMDGTFYAFE
jgi:glucose dehydrogenase